MTITIARARRDDAFACAALRLRSDLEEGHPNRAGFVTEYADDFLSAFDEVPTWIATRSDGTVVGTVTSGTFSPTLGQGIGLALLDNGYKPGFAAELMLKDLRLSQQAADSADADTPMGALATSLYGQFVEAEDGRGRDFSAMLPRLAARGRGAA